MRTLVQGARLRGAPIATLALLVIAWEAAVRRFHLPIYLVPAPSDVIQTLASQVGILSDDVWTTGVEVVVSYLVCVLIGIPLGIAAVKSRFFAQTGYPILVASQSVPILAAAPLFVVWFGIGLGSKLLITLLITFFPIVVSTAVGLRSVDPNTVMLARSMGLGPRQRFFKIDLPAALPNIFGGLKLASSIVIVGAVVSEFVSSTAGLGYRVLVATGMLDTPLLFSALLLMVVMGLLFYGAISTLERVVVPWRHDGQESVTRQRRTARR